MPHKNSLPKAAHKMYTGEIRVVRLSNFQLMLLATSLQPVESHRRVWLQSLKVPYWNQESSVVNKDLPLFHHAFKHECFLKVTVLCEKENKTKQYTTHTTHYIFKRPMAGLVIADAIRTVLKNCWGWLRMFYSWLITAKTEHRRSGGSEVLFGLTAWYHWLKVCIFDPLLPNNIM